MQLLKKDILTVNRGFILHQVNCKGVMNKGLAKEIRNLYPQTFLDYKEFLDKNTRTQDVNGEKVIRCNALGGFKTTQLHPHHYIVHCYAQYDYGSDGKRYTDYDALREALTSFDFYKIIAHDVWSNEVLPVYVPEGMGCGYGGGDWGVVKNILTEIIPNAIICRK